MSILDYMTTVEYMKIRYGGRPARHWWGTAHRHWLLSSGRYIRTTERDQEYIDAMLSALRKFNARN